jgi:RNA 3'-terminal phosphate cyclase (ATP)
MEPIKIDGGFGEGGGQIIRSAVTLSAVTGKPVHIENIRKNRKVPGIRPQHMLGIKTLSKICQARVEGLYVNSTSLKFFPSKGLNLDLQEDVGTAGSIPLILQILIPAVSLMKNSLRLSIIGGTDVPWSPTSDYTKYVLGEAFSRIGINFTYDIKRRGYYPKGGGMVDIHIQPSRNFNPISLIERRVMSAKLLCVYSHIPKESIEREIYNANTILNKNGFDCKISIEKNNALDKGCSILIFSYDENSIIGSDSIYQKSLNGLGELVAKKFIESNLGVDLCLSDMLVVPLSLIKDTSIYRVKQITKHLETNLFVASKITGSKYGIGKLDDGFEVRISGI